MFDGVPFGCAGGVVTKRDSQTILEAERVPQVVFQCDGCGPITSSIVGENEDVLGIWVLLGAVAVPPGYDGLCGKGRRVVTGSDAYHPSVGYRVVNAIRADFRFCI